MAESRVRRHARGQPTPAAAALPGQREATRRHRRRRRAATDVRRGLRPTGSLWQQLLMYGLTSDGVSVAARSRVSETACRRNTRLPGSVPRLPGSVPCLGPVDEQAPSPSAGNPMHTRRPSAVRGSDARSDPSQNPVEAAGPGLVSWVGAGYGQRASRPRPSSPPATVNPSVTVERSAPCLAPVERSAPRN